MMGIIKKLGSIGFTIFISIALIVLLIISTSMEAVHGTSFAQKVFYQTIWFDFLVSLLWVNIFCSTILRIPFKKEQIGFLVTHLGILGILAGALITKAFAVEGQLMLFEGESSDRIRRSGYALTVRFPSQEEVQYELRKGDGQFFLTPARLNANEPFCPLKKNDKATGDNASGGGGLAIPFRVTEILPNAAESIKVAQGASGAKDNQATRISIKSKQLKLDRSVWLIEREPGNDLSAEVIVGPVRLDLRPFRKVAPPRNPIFKVLNKSGQELLTVDLEEKDFSKQKALPKTGFTIKNLAYYPYASVVGNKLQNFPEGKRFNPAVEFDLVDNKGNALHQVRFAFFPDFESMHGTKKSASSDLKFTLDAGDPKDWEMPFDGVQVTVMYDQDGRYSYQVKVQGKATGEGEVVIGKTVALDAMGLEFKVEELFSRADISYAVGPAPDQKGSLAVAVTLSGANGPAVYWVLENKATRVHLSKGEVFFALTPKTTQIPFSLALKQFRRINYPGTQDSAAYESDVVLADAKKGITLERTISMNAPLLYDGYKVFQTSYIEDPSDGKASIFTVARNPGIIWIYTSSILACLGAIFQFYGVKQKDSQC